MAQLGTVSANIAVAQYTFFPAAHGTFSKMYHILEHKASLNKHEKIEKTLPLLPYLIRQQWNKTETKLQKIFKHVKTEHYTVE
jgi:hypothetical protein